jgi:hypothetical protein
VRIHNVVFIIFLGMTLLGICEEPVALGGADVVPRITGKGNRPYVVVWIEDNAGERVRTLKVWGNKTKYQRKLKIWQAGGGTVNGISGATRPNGDYRVSWDGRNDAGELVAAGTYVIRAESAREEGDHCQAKVQFLYTPTPVRVEAEGEKDIQALFVRSPSVPETGQ